jgi:Ca2+-binding RTX toxin-like protein
MFLSAAPIPYVQDGILKVWGTPGDDTIIVQTSNGLSPYIVTVDDVVTTISVPGIKGLHIHAGAGNDTINLDDVVRGANGEITLTVVSIPATVFGGKGDDAITGTPYDVRDQLHGGPGNDTITGSGVIYGGQGNDDITCVGDGSNTVYGGLGDDSISNGNAPSDSIVGGGGNDTITGNSDPVEAMPG